ncbi:MAG: 50S ribosomal protein L22 [Thaumarchaeota archaeon]|nr:50S ribosomal protein L22 [Nitrososphaerota archaeon]
MPEFGYAFQGYNPVVHVRASLREADLSPKEAREVCEAIKGLPIDRAKALLNDVVSLRRPVPFRRHHGKVGHKSGLQGFYAGRYPVKVARAVLRLLESLEANAEYRGLDPSRLKLIHAAAYPGRRLKRYVPRAFGRASPKDKVLVHIELVGAEA